MPQRIAAFAFFGLLTLFPGCITTKAYDTLTTPIVDEEPRVPPATRIEAISNASVAVVEDRLQLCLDVRCYDGKHRFLAAPVAGRDEEEPAARAFAPIDVAALPSTVVAVKFMRDVKGFGDHDVAWWHARSVLDGNEAYDPERPIAREDLENAALVSVNATSANTWQVFASVPDGKPRELVKSDEGVVPVIDARDNAPFQLAGPPTPPPFRHEHGRTAGTLGFVAIAPFTLTLDAAVGTVEVAGIAVLIPVAILTLPFWAHSVGC